MADADSRLYVAGAGTVGRHHARAAEKLPGDVSISVADPNPDALEGFERQFPGVRTFEDPETMFAEPARETDVVVVAAPPFAHREIAVAGLESGRHVLCEKPLAIDVAEARAMLAAAREADRLLGSASCRFLGVPTTERAAALLDEDAVGEPYHVHWMDRSQRSRPGIESQTDTDWFLDRERSGGGVLVDWGPYDVATLDHVLDPERVEVRAAWTADPETAVDPDDADVEQHVGATLVYHLDDGTTLPVSYERAACTHGTPRKWFEIEGTRGAVRWGWKVFSPGGRAELLRTFDRNGEVDVESERPADGGAFGPHDRPLAYFSRAIRGEDAPIPVNERAVFNFEVLRAIYDCAETDDPQVVESPMVRRPEPTG